MSCSMHAIWTIRFLKIVITCPVTSDWSSSYLVKFICYLFISHGIFFHFPLEFPDASWTLNASNVTRSSFHVKAVSFKNPLYQHFWDSLDSPLCLLCPNFTYYIPCMLHSELHFLWNIITFMWYPIVNKSCIADCIVYIFSPSGARKNCCAVIEWCGRSSGSGSCCWPKFSA